MEVLHGLPIPRGDLFRLQAKDLLTAQPNAAALRAHKSQMKEWDPGDTIREWAAERGKGKEMAYKLDELIAAGAALEWPAPTCGVMAP